MDTVGTLTIEAFEELLDKHVRDEITNLKDELHLTLDKKFKSIESRLDVFESRFKAIDSQLNLIDGQFKRIIGLISDIIEAQSRRDEKVFDLKQHVHHLESRLKSVEGTVQNLQLAAT